MKAIVKTYLTPFEKGSEVTITKVTNAMSKVTLLGVGSWYTLTEKIEDHLEIIKPNK